MEINAPKRIASMSVGEFANFTPYPNRAGSEGFGIWRAQAGAVKHAEVQKLSAEANEGFQNEVPISGNLDWRGWKLELNGRIDQFDPSPNRPRIREIKTVTDRLPLPMHALSRRFPHYFFQAQTYFELLHRAGTIDPELSSLELLLVELDSGITQTVKITDNQKASFVDHVDRLVDFLESKRERLDKLHGLKFIPAYETPRPGQESIQNDLATAFAAHQIVFLEAPTGYGKTGVAWEAALRGLANGDYERIIYLTSKTTGQIEAVNRLSTMLGSDPQATFWHIRNKQEHCINSEFRCSTSCCAYLEDIGEKWQRSGLQRLYLLSSDTLSIEQLKTQSSSVGICPYETMRAALGFRDIWIGDYNYLFSSNSSRLMREQIDFDPGKTMLIIDEAHNLPDRVESSLSVELDALALSAAGEELRHEHSSRRIQRILAHLSSDAANGNAKTTLSDPEFEDLVDQLLELAKICSDEPLPSENLSTQTLDLLWSLASTARSIERNQLPYLAWRPDRGRIRLVCLDAAPLTGSILAEFKRALLLSATLSPPEVFSRRIGLPDELAAPPHLQPPAPWLDTAFDLAVDLRADTRYRARLKTAPLTAKTLAQMADRFGPVIAFFPSYAYARTIHNQLANEYPFLRVAQQESGGSLAERTEFIDHALAFNDLVLLVLGSSFAEGIDLLGGKVKAAVIVSPALPEANPIQEAKREHYQRLGESGFERAYLMPGIQKVNQALGRLARAPGQKVKALLHCERFGEPKTRELLSSHLQPRAYIHEQNDFDAWLDS